MTPNKKIFYWSLTRALNIFFIVLRSIELSEFVWFSFTDRLYILLIIFAFACSLRAIIVSCQHMEVSYKFIFWIFNAITNRPHISESYSNHCVLNFMIFITFYCGRKNTYNQNSWSSLIFIAKSIKQSLSSVRERLVRFRYHDFRNCFFCKREWDDKNTKNRENMHRTLSQGLEFIKYL